MADQIYVGVPITIAQTVHSDVRMYGIYTLQYVHSVVFMTKFEFLLCSVQKNKKDEIRQEVELKLSDKFVTFGDEISSVFPCEKFVQNLSKICWPKLRFIKSTPGKFKSFAPFLKDRVIRLGEFSQFFGRLFTLGSFSKMT
jgi:hypothetical protein